MRILLIEDDMLIGDGIKTGLSKMGFSVDWFTQGRQGKEALYSAPYDAVILDLTLPGMDGRDILREWREKGQREPVLILTARDALAERVESAKSLRDDTWVTLRGNIVERISDDLYVFKDASGTINVDIDHKRWNGVTVTPKDTVEIQGEVDKDWNSVEIDVKQIRKVNP